ncbi:MAG: hypothetical protein E7L19_11760, partial [Acinetobacter baumannii]|nr:hypothetical protein [Acinetobacter baumannii]
MLRYLFPSLFSIILLNTVVTVNAKTISSKNELNPIPQGGPTLVQAQLVPNYKDISANSNMRCDSFKSHMI